MSDTFNAFVKFISDDPIMLGLCIAIIVLVIMFIIVLIIGRKKDSNKEIIENNTDLLKTEINLEAIKSTQEYNFSELNGENLAIMEQEANNAAKIIPVEEPNISAPEIVNETYAVEESEIYDADIKEVPVTIEEPVAVEVFSEEMPNIFDIQTTSEVVVPPIIEEAAMEKVENIEESITNITEPEPTFETLSTSFEGIIKDTNEPILLETPIETVSDFPAFDNEPITLEPLDEATVMPIIESTVNPIDNEPLEITLQNNLEINETENITESIEPSLAEESVEIKENTESTEIPTETEVELPSITEPVTTFGKESEYLNTSVYLEINDINPDFNIEDFDKTAILRQVPIMDTTPTTENKSTNVEEKNLDSEESLDDIDLPKLNTNNDTSALNALKGESFDIN